jgi:hypothetical protein
MRSLNFGAATIAAALLGGFGSRIVEPLQLGASARPRSKREAVAEKSKDPFFRIRGTGRRGARQRMQTMEDARLEHFRCEVRPRYFSVRQSAAR